VTAKTCAGHGYLARALCSRLRSDGQFRNDALKGLLPMTEPISGFIERYARYSAAGDADNLAAMYAPAVLVGRPQGSQLTPAADILRSIPQRKRLLQSAGAGDARLTSLHESPLDDRYTLVKTTWKWPFTTSGDQSVDLELPSTFIVERTDDDLRIVVYLAHYDLMAMLRERRLLPST
jgi:hypothetical protein